MTDPQYRRDWDSPITAILHRPALWSEVVGLYTMPGQWLQWQQGVPLHCVNLQGNGSGRNFGDGALLDVIIGEMRGRDDGG